MQPSASLVTSNATFKINQLKKTLRDRVGSDIQAWMEDGVECELLSASKGKGWQQGKIRIRIEFVPNEPEPSPDTNFLDDLRKDIATEQ